VTKKYRHKNNQLFPGQERSESNHPKGLNDAQDGRLRFGYFCVSKLGAHRLIMVAGGAD